MRWRCRKGSKADSHKRSRKREEKRSRQGQQQPRDGYGDGDGDGAHACDDISKSQGVRSSEAEAMAMIL